jgi:hypothetical protein
MAGKCLEFYDDGETQASLDLDKLLRKIKDDNIERFTVTKRNNVTKICGSDKLLSGLIKPVARVIDAVGETLNDDGSKKNK